MLSMLGTRTRAFEESLSSAALPAVLRLLSAEVKVRVRRTPALFEPVVVVAGARSFFVVAVEIASNRVIAIAGAAAPAGEIFDLSKCSPPLVPESPITVSLWKKR